MLRTFATLLSLSALLVAPVAQAQLGPAPVNLRTAGQYTVLAKTAVTNVPTSAITGDIGISPAGVTSITGFGLTSATGYATSTQVVGRIYGADQATPTPTNLTVAIGDMETAYTDAAGRVGPNFSEFFSGDIGGKVLAPGLYKWSGGVTAPTNFSLAGGPNDVWIFQIAGTLGLSTNVTMTLSGGAQARNIFWQTAGAVNLGTGSHLEGVLLSKTGINLFTGASLVGRTLAQSAVTLDKNTITPPPATSTATDEVEVAGVSLRIFPNPARTSVRIEGLTAAAEVVDLLGRVVVRAMPGEALDVSAWAPGVYVVMASTPQRFVVAR